MTKGIQAEARSKILCKCKSVRPCPSNKLLQYFHAAASTVFQLCRLLLFSNFPDGDYLILYSPNWFILFIEKCHF